MREERPQVHRVTACKVEDDYKLWLRFDDGLEGSVFLGNLLEIGAFKLWRDVREFEKVSVDPETATVTWEGGHPARPGHPLPGSGGEGCALMGCREGFSPRPGSDSRPRLNSPARNGRAPFVQLPVRS
jgi:hypothetical protein